MDVSLGHEEGLGAKNWCFQIAVLEKTLESPLDSKEIKQANPKVNQPWIFTGRTDAEAEDPILWPPDVKSQLTGKEPDAGKNWGQEEKKETLTGKEPVAGKDWGQEEKKETEDEIVGRHHRLNGHEFEQTLGDGEGQGSLVCCSPWGYNELDRT